MKCEFCRRKLILMDWNSRGYALMCDNWRCHLFRQPQGYKAKERPNDYAVKPAGTFVGTSTI